ncbi:AzlC family ABC transporter permease [Corynebacterium doosanense]|uniref:Branched-chain amino acid ABC transporter permease n=1 Tax=Corynebacterium doosanense CAU 212 = DSM 45436 TaxID=558173 RepID=A0A097IJ02_9CORY|nr:AzlC family ABC transporter permease [Corynebacterium doosanense]AIT62104.1 branched-chain amino acid ABC transporter permease [Corynebacterium doosanense CAU 212 = DSM 45436]
MPARGEVAAGLRDSWAVGLGLVPLGLAFGLLVVQTGFDWWWAPVFSIVLYAGSMEFLALGLITAGTGWVTALIIGVLVNFRHIFYGLTYPRHRIGPLLGRGYATYALTDEVYAITGRFGSDGLEDGRPVSSTRLLTISLFCQLSWVISGIVGALGGSAVVISWEGLDFALTALFVVLAVEAFRNNPDFSLPLCAALFGVAAALLLPQQLLLAALSVYFVLLVVRFLSPRIDALLTLRPEERR